MEKFILEKDIIAMCVTAEDALEGIMDAQEKLVSIVPQSRNRRYFGISRPETERGIVYRAAAEELYEGESEKLGLPVFILKKGDYTSLVIHNYAKNLPAIGEAFQTLIANPAIDPEGACVEWYITEKDVKCMVRLKG